MPKKKRPNKDPWKRYEGRTRWERRPMFQPANLEWTHVVVALIGEGKPFRLSTGYRPKTQWLNYYLWENKTIPVKVTVGPKKLYTYEFFPE